MFLEYTYKYFDKFTLVAGVREDMQDKNEFIFTPRLHAKYNFTENFIFRLSGGSSYRKPYILADHLSVLASARQIEFRELINPEKAWNYGGNVTYKGTLFSREFSISADAYRTEFTDQLVVDTYSDSSKISFYNLNGKSFSNSFQLTINAELIERLNFRVGYKLEDVKSTFNGKLEKQPLIAEKRVLASLGYNTENEHWKFDYTAVYEGEKKLQNVFYDSESGNKKYSPSFILMNFQVTKVFRKFEMYAGSENLTDYRQLHPIIHPENPFGNSFDATNVWGPIQGRRIYLGLRLSIS
jgi:outer membrane receptor protein involved in Fe transport